MRPATRQDYQRRLDDFHEFTGKHQLPLRMANQLGRALLEYLDFFFLEGQRPDAGEGVVAALRFFRSESSEGAGMPLPRMARALKGSRRSAPAGARFGLPWEWACGLTACLTHLGYHGSALMLLVIMDTYICPGEATDTRKQDVAEAVPRATGCERPALISRPLERGRPRKPGTYDDTIVLASRDVNLDAAIMKCKRRMRKDDSFFGVILEQALAAREHLLEAAEMLGLDDGHLCLYQTRRGGVSRDALLRRRTAEEIRRRGGWATVAFVNRYEKHGQLQRALARTAPDIINVCIKAMQRIQQIIDERRVPFKLE